MKSLSIADLFCGAGGTSARAICAAGIGQNANVSELLRKAKAE